MLTLQIKGIDQPFISLEAEIGLMQSPARWSAVMESNRGIVPGAIAYSGEPDPTDPEKVLFADSVTIVDNAPAQVFRDGQLLIDGYVDKISITYGSNGYSCKVEGRSKSADYVEGSIAPGPHNYTWTGITLDELAHEMLPTYRRHRKSRFDTSEVDEEIIGERETQFFTRPDDEPVDTGIIDPRTGETIQSNITGFARTVREDALRDISTGFVLSAGFDWSAKSLNDLLTEPEFRYIYRRTDLNLEEKRAAVEEELRRLGYSPDTTPQIKFNSPESFTLTNLSAQPSKSPWTLVKEEAEKRSFLLYDTGTFCTLWNADYGISNGKHLTENLMNSYNLTIDNTNRFHGYIASDHSNSMQPDTMTTEAEDDTLSVAEQRQLDEILNQRAETDQETKERLKQEIWNTIQAAHRRYNIMYGPIKTDVARTQLWMRREALKHYSNELDNAVTIDQLTKLKLATETMLNEISPRSNGEPGSVIPFITSDQVPDAEIIPRTSVTYLPAGNGIANFVKQVINPYDQSPLQEDVTTSVRDMNIRTSRIKIFYQGEEEELGIYQKFNRFDAQSENEVDLQQKTIWEAKKRAAAAQSFQCTMDSHDFVVGDLHRVTVPSAGLDQGRIISKATYKQSDGAGEATVITMVRKDHLEPPEYFLPDQSIVEASLEDLPEEAQPETGEFVYVDENNQLVVLDYDKISDDTPVAIRTPDGGEITITYAQAVARYGQFREIVSPAVIDAAGLYAFGEKNPFVQLWDGMGAMWNAARGWAGAVRNAFTNEDERLEFFRNPTKAWSYSAAYHVIPLSTESELTGLYTTRVVLDVENNDARIVYVPLQGNALGAYEVQQYAEEQAQYVSRGLLSQEDEVASIYRNNPALAAEHMQRFIESGDLEGNTSVAEKKATGEIPAGGPPENIVGR